ncbi:uncharacterized protein LOC143447281 isoform X5 [Clavelina lepadiformis]|uniref:uncharacterized protein LOC143447281 isoform X5 n=1 Tax=Clavelina lepadiformis TaxID=159417 RepID=UPI0040438DB6
MTQGNKVIFRDFTATETLKTSKNTKGAEIIPPQNLTWTNNWNTFCSFETDQVCADIPLNQCPTCRHYSFWLFFTLIFLLAVWILLANSFVIAYIIKRKRSLRTSLDLLKGSLAVTDLLTGFLLFTTALPNIAWTTRLTSRQLYVETRKLADTPVAIVSATLYLLFIYSTLYHLVLMSYNRFAAIKWPLAPQTVKKTKINLLLLWLLALAAASYPDGYFVCDGDSHTSRQQKSPRTIERIFPGPRADYKKRENSSNNSGDDEDRIHNHSCANHNSPRIKFYWNQSSNSTYLHVLLCPLQQCNQRLDISGQGPRFQGFCDKRFREELQMEINHEITQSIQ